MKHRVDFNSLHGRNGEHSSIGRFHVLSGGIFRGIDALKDAHGRWTPHYHDEPMSDENFMNHRAMERWLNKTVGEDMIDPAPAPEPDLFGDPDADVRAIVAEEFARDAVVTGVVRQRFSILVRAKWNDEEWIVDIGPRRVLCKHIDSPTSSCHPTGAYAHLFEEAAA